MPTDVPDYFTGPELAKVMHVSDRTVINMRIRGELHAERLGARVYRYPSDQAAVAPFVARLRRRLATMAPVPA